MKKLFLLSLAAAGMLATSCNDYNPLGEDLAHFQYRKEFVKAFGDIDPNHTWNFAEQQAVFVSPGSSQDVKIYAKTDGVYTLAGSFTGIDHAQWMHVDVVAGTTELMVVNGNRTMQTVVGGEVDFSSTRALPYSVDGVTIRNNDGTTWRYLTIDAAKATEYERLLPAGQDNRGRLTEDFLYVSDGPFILHPQSWGAWAPDKVGIYYYDNSGNKHEVEVFEIRGGVDVLAYSNGTSDWQANTDNISYYKFAEYNGERLRGGGDKDNNCHKETSKGFYVDIPVGMTFGIYVQNPWENNRKMYSEKVYNTVDGSSHAVTFTMDGDLYIGMEDDDTQSDNDLNDIIVCIKGAPNIPTTLDQEVTSWVLCYEDLGNTFDIDYNDVVIGVTNAVDNKVTVTPLAAGGTLASYVFYNDTPVGSPNTDEDDGEIHGMFGFPKAKSGEYAPINVKANDVTSFDTGIKRQVTVGNNFTLSSFEVGGADATPNTRPAMGGFNVKVVPAGEESTAHKATKDGQTIAPSTEKYIASGNNIPYVFCVPYRWTQSDGTYAYYRWSNELVPMTTSYSTANKSFANWVSNKVDATDWYKNPDIYTTTSAHAHHETVGDGNGNHQFEGGHHVDHERTYMPFYDFEECVIDREEIAVTSDAHLSSGTISQYELEIDKSALVIHHMHESVDGDAIKEEAVTHNLINYANLRLAFVATGLSGTNHALNLKIYTKDSNGNKTQVGNNLTINDASTKAVDGAEAHADYVEVTIPNSQMNWNNGNKLVVEVESHTSDIHLNSIWAAIPHEDFHVMPVANIAQMFTTNNSEISVALAFVGANQHVMDYTSRNGYCSFGNYATMLTQVQNNGQKNDPTILFKLVRKSDGKYVLKNHNNQYLQAPTSEAVHAWTNEENQAAVLEFDVISENTLLMVGCTSGNDGNAVLMKTTVNEDTYYLSATNKPTWWRKNPSEAQKAIYLFHWGRHN